MLISTMKIVLIILWVGGWTLIGWPVAWADPRRAHARIMAMMQRCFKGVLKIAGVRVEMKGHLSAERPLLLVTNHVSYMDIPILGSAAPVRFTPKAEIARWPMIGMCSRLLQCVFIDRRMTRTNANREHLRAALAEKTVICLFPEGTTGDGKRLQPFRSSYFALTEERFDGKPLAVQTAAVVYTHVDGLPIDSCQWPLIAWYGDMNMLSHALKLLSLGPIRARVEFGPTLALDGIKNRKDMAARAESEVRALLNH